MSRIDDLQAAAKLIETDGDEAYFTCRDRYGEDVALALLIAHLRRAVGSMESYPPNHAIDERVEAHLQRMRIHTQ